MSLDIKRSKTNRGFDLIEFTDRYGEACSLHRCVECSLQESSLATETAIWLGITDAQPMIMAVDAIQLGIPTYGQTTGWIDLPIPKEASVHSRMHLTQEQVKELLPYLQRFAETGEF